MKNFEKKIEGLEKLVGSEKDKTITEDLGNGMYQIRRRNAVVILPKQLTPEQWNARLKNKTATAQDFEDYFGKKSIKESKNGDGSLSFTADGLAWYRYMDGRWLQLLDPLKNTWGKPV